LLGATVARGATTPPPAPTPAEIAASAKASKAKAQTATPSPYVGTEASEHGAEVYALRWGVSDLRTRLTGQGELVRFSYHVVDPAKAAVLVDKGQDPKLFNPRTNAELSIPKMEKIGELRQTMPLEKDRSYWMVFSNKGGLVKTGDRVTLKVGTLVLKGILVE